MNSEAIPYCGPAPLPGDWLERWTIDPALWTLLALGGVLVLRSARHQGRAGLALTCLAILFVSPVCALSSALFSVRVAHHLLLTAFVAPLLVHALPRLTVTGGASLWGAIHIVIFWLWHAPAAYAAALSSDAIYWAMQLSLVLSALGFWASLRHASAPLAIVVLLVMMVAMGLLGALITLSPAPLYAPHWLTTQPWGLTPLEDQQLAGLLMWAPGALFYLTVALWNGWHMLGPARVATARS